MKKIWNIFTTILAVLGLIALAWFVISYAEVCVKNLDNPPQYWDWNLFKLLIER
jgi:hypothetical protein